jgi:hypothetical protein
LRQVGSLALLISRCGLSCRCSSCWPLLLPSIMLSCAVFASSIVLKGPKRSPWCVDLSEGDRAISTVHRTNARRHMSELASADASGSFRKGRGVRVRLINRCRRERAARRPRRLMQMKRSVLADGSVGDQRERARETRRLSSARPLGRSRALRGQVSLSLRIRVRSRCG